MHTPLTILLYCCVCMQVYAQAVPIDTTQSNPKGTSKKVSQLSLGSTTIMAGYDGRLLWYSDTSLTPYYTAISTGVELLGTSLLIDMQYHPGTNVSNPVNRFSVSYSKLPALSQSLEQIGNRTPEQILRKIDVDTMYERQLAIVKQKQHTIQKLAKEVNKVLLDTTSFADWQPIVSEYKQQIRTLRAEVKAIEDHYGPLLQAYEKVREEQHKLVGFRDTLKQSTGGTFSKKKQQLQHLLQEHIDHFHLGTFSVQHSYLAAVRGRVQGAGIGATMRNTSVHLFYGTTDPMVGIGLSDSILPQYQVKGGKISRETYYLEGVHYTQHEEAFSNWVIGGGWTESYNNQQVAVRLGYAFTDVDMASLTPGEYDNQRADSGQHLALQIDASGALWDRLFDYQLSIGRIGNHYVNVGDPFLLPGSSTLDGQASIHLFKRKLGVSMITRHKLLYGRQVISNNGWSITGLFEKWPQISFSYFPQAMNSISGNAQYELSLSETYQVDDWQLTFGVSGISNTVLVQAPFKQPDEFDSQMLQATSTIQTPGNAIVSSSATYYLSLNGQQVSMWEGQCNIQVPLAKGNLSAGSNLIRQNGAWQVGYRGEMAYTLAKCLQVRAGYQKIVRNQLFIDWQNQNRYATIAVSTTF